MSSLHQRCLPRGDPVVLPPAVQRGREASAQIKQNPGDEKIGAARLALQEMSQLLDPGALAEVIDYAARKISIDKLVVDLNLSTVSRCGVTLKLQPTHVSALYCLNAAYPETVTLDKIRQAVWGRSELENPRREEATARVLVSHMRPLLSLLGVSIVNVFNKGYRLELGNME